MNEAESLIVDTHPEELRSERSKTKGGHGSVQGPPPLPLRVRYRTTWRALKWVLMPVVAGGSMFAVAALPLVVAFTFDLLGPGDNGLGLGMLAALGASLGTAVFVVGEVAVFAVWLGSGLSRARERRRAASRRTRNHNLAEPREVRLDAAGRAQRPALAVPVALERD